MIEVESLFLVEVMLHFHCMTSYITSYWMGEFPLISSGSWVCQNKFTKNTILCDNITKTNHK